MGLVLSCCLANACCASTSIISCICCSIPWHKSIAAKFTFTITFILVFFSVVIISKLLLPWIPTSDTHCNKECQAFMLVYRMAVALIFYHFTLALLLFGTNNHRDPRYHLHETFWPLKLIFLGVAVYLAFLVPISILMTFREIALVFSVFYILLQGLFFVSMAHDISESWIDLYHQTEAQFYAISLIITTLLLNLGSLSAAIFLFVFYPHDTKTLVIVSVTLFVGLIQTLVSIWPFVQSFNPRSGILQPSFVTFYNFYLITSATLLNQKPPSFEAYSGSENPWLLYTGLAMTFISLGYSAMNSGVKSSKLTLNSTSGALDLEIGGDSDSTTGSLLLSKSTPKVSESDNGYCYNYSFFHVIFILAACYAALVLTGWKQPAFEDNLFFTVPTVAAYWMRIGSSWIVSFLYIFTVFAPRIFPDREFGFD